MNNAVCCLYSQTPEGFVVKRVYDSFAAMKGDARRLEDKQERILYWWRDLYELRGGKQ